MTVSKYWREMPHRYRLEASKCINCSQVYIPKRQICPSCGHRKFESVNLDREGKLISYTVIHIAPNKFKDQIPYAVGIVELKGGGRLLAQIVDCELSDLKTGMSLKVEFRRVSEEGDAGIINYGYKCVPL